MCHRCCSGARQRATCQTLEVEQWWGEDGEEGGVEGELQGKGWGWQSAPP